MQLTILLVDDHPAYRAGLRAILESEFTILGEAADGDAAIRLIDECCPDIVILDLVMSGTDGIGVMKHVRKTDKKTAFLVLTSFESDFDLTEAVEAGANGYLLKDATAVEIKDALKRIAQGEKALAPRVASKLWSQWVRPGEERLTSRELEVLKQVAAGKSNKIIASDLFISESTVKTHLLHIFEKLAVNDRTSAVVKGVERGDIRF